MNEGAAYARRRAHAPSSLAAGEFLNNSGSPHENSRNGNGRWKRPRGETKLQGHVNRYVERKGKSISRMKRMCIKIGNLRVVDAAFFIALATKMGSMLYSRQITLGGKNQPTGAPSASLESDPPNQGQNARLPKWFRKWAEHKMQFHSPLLYRREDDDYSFGRDSYLDDDEEIDGKQMKKVRFKGMFRKDLELYEEELNSRGYAVVDDVLYNADRYRFRTQLALSHFELQTQRMFDETEAFAQHAFEIGDDDQNQTHYIDDDSIYDHYYSFDDDNIRGTIGMGLDDEYEGIGPIDLDGRDKCTMPSFYRTYYPTCNEMHASLSGYQWLLGEETYSKRWKARNDLQHRLQHLSKYLSHGYYRDAFLFRFLSYDDKNEWDQVVFKTMKHMYFSENSHADDDDTNQRGLGFDPFDKYTFMNLREDMRKDAMVMELLSSSQTIINIYSHCAMSSVVEFAPTEIDEYIMPTYGYSPKKLDRRGLGNELEGPLNDHISPQEKLEIALEMARSIAAMHGFEDGVIAHVDVQVGQFLRGQDGKVKLVDFNRAEPLLYDAKNERYCKWTNGKPPDGNFRAPEEIIDAPLTEKIDVFSLGNVFYSLLTGRMVWEEYEFEDRTEMMIRGITLPIPDIYNKSAISENLVRAIEACWTFDAEERPSIFQVVDFLERSIEASKDNG